MSFQAWRDRAACRGADPRLFFPEDGEPARHALAICAGCPVLTDCRQHALTRPEVWGVWGGMPERDRRQPRTSGSSRFRGVTWSKTVGKWQARTVRDGRRVYLGVFEDEEEAGLAVLKADGALPELTASSIPQSRKAVAA